MYKSGLKYRELDVNSSSMTGALESKTDLGAEVVYACLMTIQTARRRELYTYHNVGAYLPALCIASWSPEESGTTCSECMLSYIRLSLILDMHLIPAHNSRRVRPWA